MDTKLQWKAHIEEIRRKTTKTVNALSCLGGSTWGVGLMDMRGIYEGTALPQMMYTCSIWSNGSTKGKTYTGKTLEALRSVQARAARTICGAWVKPVGMRLGKNNRLRGARNRTRSSVRGGAFMLLGPVLRLLSLNQSCGRYPIPPIRIADTPVSRYGLVSDTYRRYSYEGLAFTQTSKISPVRSYNS